MIEIILKLANIAEILLGLQSYKINCIVSHVNCWFYNNKEC